MFILSADGAVSALVSQSKDGPVYDVQWAPDGLRYVYIHTYILVYLCQSVFFLSHTLVYIGPVNSRTMFAATDADLLWNSTGI